MSDKQRGRKAMFWSVAILHVWGSLIVMAAYNGNASPVLGDMFSAICVGIAANLAVIAGDKGLMEYVQKRGEQKSAAQAEQTVV